MSEFQLIRYGSKGKSVVEVTPSDVADDVASRRLSQHETIKSGFHIVAVSIVLVSIPLVYFGIVSEFSIIFASVIAVCLIIIQYLYPDVDDISTSTEPIDDPSMYDGDIEAILGYDDALDPPKRILFLIARNHIRQIAVSKFPF